MRMPQPSIYSLDAEAKRRYHVHEKQILSKANSEVFAANFLAPMVVVLLLRMENVAKTLKL